MQAEKGTKQAKQDACVKLCSSFVKKAKQAENGAKQAKQAKQDACFKPF